MVNNKKKKLLIATDNFLPRWDGISRFLAELIPRLKEDYEIIVIAPDYGSSYLDKDVKRIRVPLRKFIWGDYTPAKPDKKVLKAAVKKADLVFTQTIGPIGGLAIKYSKKYKKPLAAYIHSIEWELVPNSVNNLFLKKISYPLAKFMVRKYYDKCNLLICPSEKIADMLRWQRITTSKHIAHLGVNTNVFKPVSKTEKLRLRKELGISEKSFIIGFHGRLGYEKNLITLARAFTRLNIENKKLLLVGEGVKELKQKLSKVKHSILFGKTNEVQKYLQIIDIYVMPSFTETTSLATLEAMSCELPVISSKVGFIQQYINNGKNGLFFDNKSNFDLFKKINRLYKEDSLRENMGKEARITVIEKFSWDECAEKIINSLEVLQN